MSQFMCHKCVKWCQRAKPRFFAPCNNNLSHGPKITDLCIFHSLFHVPIEGHTICYVVAHSQRADEKYHLNNEHTYEQLI